VFYAEQMAVCGNGNHAWAYNDGYYPQSVQCFFPELFSSATNGGTATPPQNMPTVANCNPYIPQAMTSGSCIVGLGDGSVRTVSTTINPITWYRAIWPQDGLPMGSDW
jgi:hypothetical protein